MSDFGNNSTQYIGSATTQDLNVIVDNANDLLQDIATRFSDLWNNLTTMWGSNKAVEFDSNKTSFFGGLNKSKELTNGFLSSVSASVGALAKGLGGSYSFNERLKPINDVTLKLLPSVDGIKGLQISKINSAVDDFFTFVTNKVNSFVLPQSISVSDENGNILEKFGAKINKLLGDIQEEAQYITDTIKKALESATETAELAVNQALSVLESFFITPAAAEGLDISGAGSSNGGGGAAGPSFWGQLASDYFKGLNDTFGNTKESIQGVWNHDINNVGAGIGAVTETVAYGANGLVNAVGDTAQSLNDASIGVANRLFDVGTGAEVRSREEYWQNIGNDFADNWNSLGNASNFGERVVGVLEGTGRTLADAGQAAMNAGSEAVDWTVGAFETASKYVSDRVTNLVNVLLGR